MPWRESIADRDIDSKQYIDLEGSRNPDPKQTDLCQKDMSVTDAG